MYVFLDFAGNKKLMSSTTLDFVLFSQDVLGRLEEYFIYKVLV